MGTKANKKPEQFRLPVDLIKALDAYSKASGMSKTDIVEMALREQMDKGVKERLGARIKAVKELGVGQLSRAIPHSQESARKQKAGLPSENKASQEAAG
jgi:hypothetical protein